MDNFSTVLVLGFVGASLLAVGLAVHVLWKPLGRAVMLVGGLTLAVAILMAARGMMNMEPAPRTPRPTRSSEFSMSVLHSHY